MSVLVIANLPVCAESPARVACEPCAPVSEAPNPSTTMACGTNSRSASFMCGDRIAPPDPMMKSRDRSYDPRRISSTIGRAKASPTLGALVHPPPPPPPGIPPAFEFPRSPRGDAPPALRDRPEAEPRGGAMHQRRRSHAPHEPAVRRGILRQLLDGRRTRHPGGPPGHGGVKDVLLPPEHAFGRARGTAGVEEVEIVRRRPHGRPAGPTAGPRAP